MTDGVAELARADTSTGVALELFEAGEGRPLLVLHGEGGLQRAQGFLRQLAARAHVVAPSHPGFGRSELPDWVDGVDDLVYLYLDLLDAHDLRDVTVVGLSLGGWVAAELAVQRPPRVAACVLVDAYGIRVSEDREVRDLADIWATHPEELSRLAYHDPALARVDYGSLSDEEVEIAARNQQAAVLYGWKPYLNNPKLRRRLRRVTAPTLVVWGEDDGIAPLAYGRAFADAIPGARFEVLPGAGHHPEVEQPERLAGLVAGFAEEASR
jgi:pimeloyl-ACP methyl ester carboxylesterase